VKEYQALKRRKRQATVSRAIDSGSSTSSEPRRL